MTQAVQGNNFCQSVSNCTRSAATSFANFCSSAAATARQLAQKIADFVAPYFSKGADFAKQNFSKAADFAKNNQKEIIVASAFLAIGAVLAKLFCNKTQAEPAAGTPAQAQRA